MSAMEAANREDGDENSGEDAILMPSFAQMPSWTIVAVLSRIARIVQHFAEKRSDREAVNDAIEVAEKAARFGHVDARAVEAADKARLVQVDAKKAGDNKAAVAACCAAEAALAVQLATDRATLLEAAARVVHCIQGLGNRKADSILVGEIENCARLAYGLSDSDPAPLAILDFLHYQAVHEAGHAVVASGLGILFDTVRIIYNAGVEFIRNPIDDPDDVTAEDRQKYLLGYAAGAAAEDLVLGMRREWGCVQDRHNHKQSGGRDFDGDAAQVRKYGWFSKQTILRTASLLEDHRVLSDRAVRQVMQEPQDG